MVKDLELEVRGRCRRMNLKEHVEGSTSVGGSHGEASHQSGSHRSREYRNEDLVSPERQRPQNAALDAMSRALCKAARSPFSKEIEQALMPSRFTRPSFIFYDGKTNPVEHVSHYI